MNSGGPTVVHSGQGPWGFPPSGSGNGSGRPPPGGGGPWGGGPGGPRPGGPGGGRPGGPVPDIDMIIARLQAFVRSMLGGGGPRMQFTGGRPLLLLGLVVVLLWLGTSFYRVQPDELGVVLRFGAYSYRTEPGLHWHLPWPIEKVLLPSVTRINRTEIGYRSGASVDSSGGNPSVGSDVPNESLMLTGDENIIDINMTVLWKINNAEAYLFNTRDPDALVKAVAESSIREVIGRTPIQPALNELRPQIESDVHTQTQQILDHYGAGVEITQITLQGVNPPGAVVESFIDVQRANTDAERLRNEAQAYANDIVPRARGDAARVVFEGQGAKQAAVAQATGQAQQFDAVLKAYQAAKDVTLQRMYLDTMQDILSHSQPLIVDDKLKGLVPFLPLNPPPPGRPAAPPPPPSTAAAPGLSQAPAR